MANKTKIAIILDRSSSMISLRDEMIDAFNEQVDKIKEEAKNEPTRVSFVTFASEVDEPVFWNRGTYKLKKITKEDYDPAGLTAMYDAVGTTCSKLSELDDGETAFLVIVMSDGAENNSKKYTAKSLASTIDELQKSGRWTFTYLGANQDLSQVSESLNINLDNTVGWVTSEAGVANLSKTVCNGLGNYFSARSMNLTACDNLYENKSS